MRMTKAELPMELAFTIAPPQTLHTEIHENTHSLMHWLRTHIFGECPNCKSTHNKQITGWNRMQCENCQKTWSY
jgi:hypothetical protein